MLADDAQIRMFGSNIYWLIGFLILGTIGLLVLTAIYVGIRMYLFDASQRRSLEEYEKRTRRADGKMYPPFAVGTCEHCRKICKKVYHLTSGELLCPDCYEPFWKKAERWQDPIGRSARSAAGSEE